MLPYTAYDIIRTVNHEVDLNRKPVRRFNHTFGDEIPSGSDRPGGGGRGLFASALALLGRRARPAQAAPQPLS